MNNTSQLLHAATRDFDAAGKDPVAQRHCVRRVTEVARKVYTDVAFNDFKPADGKKQSIRTSRH